HVVEVAAHEVAAGFDAGGLGGEAGGEECALGCGVVAAVAHPCPHGERDGRGGSRVRPWSSVRLICRTFVVGRALRSQLRKVASQSFLVAPLPAHQSRNFSASSTTSTMRSAPSL